MATGIVSYQAKLTYDSTCQKNSVAEPEAIHALCETQRIYRDFVDFCIPIAMKYWEEIAPLLSNQRQRFIEKKILPQKSLGEQSVLPEENMNLAMGGAFFMMPCYMRRAGISNAVGLVSSYKTKLRNFEAKLNEIVADSPFSKERNENISKKNRARMIAKKHASARELERSRTKPPKAGFANITLYKGNCFEQTGDGTCRIKLRIRNTWDWVHFRLKTSDMAYIKKHCIDKGFTQKSPDLVRHGKVFRLKFPFEWKRELPKKSETLSDIPILSVDLGLNHAATCSVMRPDGTILRRAFLSLPADEDRLSRALLRVKWQQRHGNRKARKQWASAKGINKEIASKTAKFIVNLAVECGVETIVFEHLGDIGKRIRGKSKRFRLHLWKARDTQKIVESRAHMHGIRISRVCAWNTSKLAFDGSGEVKRDAKNYSLCTFQTGKVYNCDLSASYNIGARFFIREILDRIPQPLRGELKAKVPGLAKRSTCTLSTLVNLAVA